MSILSFVRLVIVVGMAALLLAVIPSTPGMGQSPRANSMNGGLEAFAIREDLVPVAVKDGTVLRATVLLPRSGEARARPTILIFTPYVPDRMIASYSDILTRQLRSGFAIVIANERGTYYSAGKYSLLKNSLQDGSDVIAWITRQVWSDGKIGMFGCSAPGEVQHGLNSHPPQGLSATVAVSSGAGLGIVGPYHEQAGFYRGGAFQTGSWWFPWFERLGQSIRPQFPNDTSLENLRKAAKRWTLVPDRTPPHDIGEVVWTLPIDSIMQKLEALPTDMDDIVGRLPNDPEWAKLSLGSESDPYRVPMLMINSWFDAAIAPNVAMYSTQSHRPKPIVRDDLYMVVGPSKHCAMLRNPEPTAAGERDLGNYAFDYVNLISRWFDRYLRADAAAMNGVPKVQAYMMGANQWRSYDRWPPLNTRGVSLFLTSLRGANSSSGDGQLRLSPSKTSRADAYVYDWRNPVPSLGGSLNLGPDHPAGSFDQAAIELRHDVLVYTSQPLTKAVEIAGSVRSRIFVSSDVPDTDITIKLLDVYPDGRAFNLDDSIQRLRWRDGYARANLMTKGRVYPVEIGPLATSNAFLPGHRIRIEISSSNFPRYERNLNTGGDNARESIGRVAHIKIHHGGPYRSEIVLPVLNPRDVDFGNASNVSP